MTAVAGLSCVVLLPGTVVLHAGLVGLPSLSLCRRADGYALAFVLALAFAHAALALAFAHALLHLRLLQITQALLRLRLLQRLAQHRANI